MDGFIRLLDWVSDHFLGVVAVGVLVTGGAIEIIKACKGREDGL